MLNLDETIKHCEEVAKRLENSCKRDWMGEDDESCASDHRQLAEWLRELKGYRKAEKEIEQELVNWNDIDNGKCRGLYLATSIIQHYKDEEVGNEESK